MVLSALINRVELETEAVANYVARHVPVGPWPTKLSSIKAISPLSPSFKFPISKIGALSPELGFAPGNWTETCLEFESSTTDAISNDGENSIVLISNGTVTRTEALACCDGVSWTDVPSKFGTSCDPSTVNEGEPTAVGFCCRDGVIRILPKAPPVG